MYGSEIEAILYKYQSIEPYFLGVKAIDKWPTQIDDKCFFISNLSPSSHPGSHWFYVGVNSESIVEVFDCLKPKKDIILKARQFRPLVDANSQKFMPNTSRLCGSYSVYYALHRFFNPEYHMLDIFLEFFKNDIKYNDAVIIDFLKQL